MRIDNTVRATLEFVILVLLPSTLIGVVFLFVVMNGIKAGEIAHCNELSAEHNAVIADFEREMCAHRKIEINQ